MSSEEESSRGRGGGEGDGGEGEDDEECPPPQDEEKEMLFLIEFLIDAMLLKPENMLIDDMDPCLLQGQACIQLTFLHFPPMRICETDGDPCRLTGGNYIKFNSGKSLMFALSESQFENPPPIYLEVCAYKMLPHGSVPNKLPVGMTKICLVELFKQVFDKVEEKPEKLPLSKSIKDNYQLVGTKNKCPTAEVTIYIRLSCLGQNVVTEFQRGGDECEPFLFKSKESKKVYECKPKEMPGNDADELCPPLPGWGTSTGKDCPADAGKTQGCSGGGGGGGGGGGYCGNGGGGGGGGGGGQGYTSNEGADDDEFEEFGTEVLGHALTIKVQKCRKSQQNPEDAENGNQVSFQVPQSLSLCEKGKSRNKATIYNINSSEGGKCGDKEPLRIVHGVDSPDKDIFVVRIGKKGDSTGKGKLELELRTPKVKIERPSMATKKWDKMVQTEKEEQPKKGKKRK